MTSTRLSIAFFLTEFAEGGLERNILNLANWMGKAGHAVYLYAAPEHPLLKDISPCHFKIISFYKKGRHFPLENIYQLSRSLKKLKIHHLITSTNRDIELLVWTKAFCGKKVYCHYLQQMEIGVSKRDLFHQIKYSFLDTWFTPLHWLKEQLIEKTKLKKSQVKILPLCVETQRFTQIKQKHHLSETIVIGVVARIDPLKDIPTAIKAFHKLHHRSENLLLKIVAAAPPHGSEHFEYYKMLLDSASSGPMAERIKFHSPSTKIEDLFQSLDLFLMPSLAETFGMVTVEAILSGIPVIGVNRCGTAEILKHGRFGKLYEPKNEIGLAELIEQWLDNPRPQWSKTAMAREFFKKTYSSERMVCEIVERLRLIQK